MNLQASILEDFEQNSDKELLKEACLAIDVMGEQSIDGLRQWFCRAQMDEYAAAFAQGTPPATFGETGRRFAWILRELKKGQEGDTALNIFPEAW